MNRRFSMFRRLIQRLRLREQRGSMLIEVLVGSVLVVSCSAAMLDGLNGAQDTGQRNKARSEAASLSQQDQERMRAMPIEDLSNYRETRNVTVAGAPYTIESRADWVRDSSGVVSCTNDSSQAQYLKITSSTSSNVQQTPLTETSIVAPARGTFSDTDGTAAIQVVDRDLNPIAGVRVDLDGPLSLSDTTNDQGCVVFGFVPSGPWSVQVASLGLIGTDGTQPFNKDIGVVAGSTTSEQIQLDEPSSITANIITTTGSLLTTPAVKSVSANNAQLPSPGWKSVTSSTPKTSLIVDSLFPFKSGYGVYAGTCADNNPTKWDSDYFTTLGTSAFVVPTPGGGSTVSVLAPTVLMKINGIATNKKAFVFFKSADSTCAEAYPVPVAPSAASTPGIVAPNTGSAGTATLYTLPVAMPWGRFKVCVDDTGTNNSSSHTKEINTSPYVANTSGAGATATVTLPTSGTGNSCLRQGYVAG
jgi:Tfp pilus assembly protein PilV